MRRRDSRRGRFYRRGGARFSRDVWGPPKERAEARTCPDVAGESHARCSPPLGTEKACGQEVMLQRVSVGREGSAVWIGQQPPVRVNGACCART